MNKLAVFAILAGIAGGFFLGRQYPAASTQVTEVHDDTKTHTQTTTTTTKTKDGEVKTVIVTDKVKEESKDKRKESTIVAAQRPTTSVSLLAATNTSNVFGPPQYGIYVSHEIIGNITAGAFGLTNGTIGLSIGLNF